MPLTITFYHALPDGILLAILPIIFKQRAMRFISVPQVSSDSDLPMVVPGQGQKLVFYSKRLVSKSTPGHKNPLSGWILYLEIKGCPVAPEEPYSARGVWLRPIDPAGGFLRS